MSGHSHAQTVKRTKDATDAKRGKNFSKLGRLITIAVKTGGGMNDPQMNSRLRMALMKAKEANMPKDNIKRAIDKGLGKGEGLDLESITYEGYGPFGVAVIVECITDSKNRTGQEIKSLFTIHGGNLAEPGAAAHYFTRVGFVKVKKDGDGEEQMLKLIDLGAEDIEEKNDFFNVFTSVGAMEEAEKSIRDLGFEVLESDRIMKANDKMTKENAQIQKISKFVAGLENYEDVQNVFVNVEI